MSTIIDWERVANSLQKDINELDTEIKELHLKNNELKKQLSIQGVVKSFSTEQIVNELKDCETLDDAIMYFSEIK